MSAIIAASVTTAQILLGLAMACATFRMLWGPRAQDRVVGFGIQEVNALHPAPMGYASADAPSPSTRHYHPPDLPHLQALKQWLETEWVHELRRTLSIAIDDLPLLWDCDFLRGESASKDQERFVLCEINASSVAPFPDSAVEPLVAATVNSLLSRATSKH